MPILINHYYPLIPMQILVHEQEIKLSSSHLNLLVHVKERQYYLVRVLTIIIFSKIMPFNLGIDHY